MQYAGRIILGLCFLAAVYATRPGFAQTAEAPPATIPSAATPPETTPTTTSPWFPPTLLLPAITPQTNPNVISPQLQLDYNLQTPLFGELPLRQELSEKGIDFIAHYISQTASNTAGVHGTGTAYTQQVDFGLSFDLDKLGIWPDAVARYAMTDRAEPHQQDRRVFPLSVDFWTRTKSAFQRDKCREVPRRQAAGPQARLLSDGQRFCRITLSLQLHQRCFLRASNNAP